jgi:putative transcriptional regulator
MRTNTNHVRNNARVEVGSVLLAQPFWQEQDYKRSVILILDHDKWGSTGIILNKLSNLNVQDILSDSNLYHPVYYGGPHKTDMITYVHNYNTLPETKKIGNGLYFGGEPESLISMIQQGKLNGGVIRFCAGHVEWGPGELESETSEGQWWVSDIKADELFNMPYERLWSYKLLSSGHLYGVLDECPDPNLN